MEIHLGKLIKNKAKEAGISSIQLAFLVNTSRQNLNNIFNRKSTDTATLQRFCDALNFNFFQVLAETIEINTSETDIKNSQQFSLEQEVAQLRKEMDILKREIKSIHTKLP
jgi:transcriptional regulator with XRE-family HTH domain